MQCEARRDCMLIWYCSVCWNINEKSRGLLEALVVSETAIRLCPTFIVHEALSEALFDVHTIYLYNIVTVMSSATFRANVAPARAIRCARPLRRVVMCSADPQPLLLRTARGERVERTPVWLMRQAGRYMADFRKFSDKIPFRERSETSSIAVELSLQPWNAFQPDGVIMFSDILTPLPAMGIEFDVVKGTGPVISDPIRHTDDLSRLIALDDPTTSLPFVAETLKALREEVGSKATVLGFIGTPWTLAAYAIEGKADRHCTKTKQMMMNNPALLHAVLSHLADQLADYVCYQIESGAQVVQLFDSWAHHLSPEQFAEFSAPYAQRIITSVKARYPDTPLIFHANGGTGKFGQMEAISGDVLGFDWATTMADARAHYGAEKVLQGNVDPMVLFGSPEKIQEETARCLAQAGQRHILNVGHGVVQGTPEEHVGVFIDCAKKSSHVVNV